MISLQLGHVTFVRMFAVNVSLCLLAAAEAPPPSHHHDDDDVITGFSKNTAEREKQEVKLRGIKAGSGWGGRGSVAVWGRGLKWAETRAPAAAAAASLQLQSIS